MDPFALIMFAIVGGLLAAGRDELTAKDVRARVAGDVAERRGLRGGRDSDGGA